MSREQFMPASFSGQSLKFNSQQIYCNLNLVCHPIDDNGVKKVSILEFALNADKRYTLCVKKIFCQ